MTTISAPVRTATQVSNYQVMPPLSAEEYQTLRADIAEHGVLVPVVRDQHGNLLDGHHRVRIAEELEIDYPTEVKAVRDAAEARTLARVLNLSRRHLSREQKRQLIADEITANPDRSDREIGRLLACDHKTVGSVRRSRQGGEIPHDAAEAETAEPTPPAPTPLAGRGSPRIGTKTFYHRSPVLNRDAAFELVTTLRGFDMAIREMTSIDAAITAEEATRWAAELVKFSRSLRKLTAILKEHGSEP